MKFYLCIVGNFPEAKTIYKECIERQLYQYHETTKQKGPASCIVPGDVLILVFDKQLKAYGVVESQPVLSHGGHDEHWYAIHVKDGWKRVEQAVPLPYGVYWNTVRGTKQSIVKEMDVSWAIEIIQKLKRLRHENNEEMAFPIHLSELAISRNAGSPFYDIPKIQRGLVWNATRCEVLWDSILRDIPIGALSLRPTDDGRWEIFDGQQRVNTIAMGYAAWPKAPDNTEKENKPILWIDLNPSQDKGRKFVFRVTTPAHPWGYELSDDEKKDNRLATYKQREAVEKLEECWTLSKTKGARPFTWELWPVDAILPVPFAVLREFVEDHETEPTIEFKSFVAYCLGKYFGSKDYPCCNWLRIIQNSEATEPTRWKESVDAIKHLSKYAVVALNCKTMPDDLGLYFKRMNKQGVEPDDEEIQYSLLKSKIPDLKFLDKLAEKRTRPAWLAHIAVRLWLSQQDDWKWHGSISKKDIACIEQGQNDFQRFVREELPVLLERFDETLTSTENGILSWHLNELYQYGRGDGLALYFLREIYNGHPCESARALATTVLWFSYNVGKCAEMIWAAPNVSIGLFRSMQAGYLARIFEPDEIKSWVQTVRAKLLTDDWGNGNCLAQDPYVGNALGCIWNGFDGRKGCSFLLYACRKFIREYFARYNAFASEWREQNRPWDYDHILPKDWGPGNRINNRTYLVRSVLWSIGNSAPLPFSMNRSKNADAPDQYPDGTAESANNLHIGRGVEQFGLIKKQKQYDRIDRNEDASRHFIETTLDRIQCMVDDWYYSCQIGELLSFDGCNEPRKQLFESLQASMALETSQSSVWFVHGERQFPIHKTLDWAQPWLACGIQGTIKYEKEKIHCLLGVASDGKTLQIGIRRHPDVNEIPNGGWWIQCSECPLTTDVQVGKIVSDLHRLADQYQFEPE